MIHVCVWDDFAKQFLDSFSQVNDDIVFVVVKRGRIESAHGILHMSYDSINRFSFVSCYLQKYFLITSSFGH